MQGRGGFVGRDICLFFVVLALRMANELHASMSGQQRVLYLNLLVEKGKFENVETGKEG